MRMRPIILFSMKGDLDEWLESAESSLAIAKGRDLMERDAERLDSLAALVRQKLEGRAKGKRAMAAKLAHQRAKA